MPTVLIGIVSISFEEASQRNEALSYMEEKMNFITGLANQQDSTYFSEARVTAIKSVFDKMDADEGLTLDCNELGPFYQYTFDLMFGVELNENQTEALFHLMVRVTALFTLCRLRHVCHHESFVTCSTVLSASSYVMPLLPFVLGYGRRHGTRIW